MKFLLVIATAIAISGCSIFGARFDSNEYASFVHLHTEAAVAIDNCNNPDALRANIDSMVEEITFLYTYTKHLPNNSNTFNIATILRANINELDQAYTDGTKSETYCHFKLKLMTQHLDRALEAVAVKGR